MFFFFLHCPLSGPVLIYISLLIISCIIEYVTNKITLNLEAADRSSKISNEDLEAVLASLRSSTTESKAVSVECPLLNPDWLLSRRLFCVRKAVTCLNTTRSSVHLQ